MWFSLGAGSWEREARSMSREAASVCVHGGIAIYPNLLLSLIVIPGWE